MCIYITQYVYSKKLKEKRDGEGEREEIMTNIEKKGSKIEKNI